MSSYFAQVLLPGGDTIVRPPVPPYARHYGGEPWSEPTHTDIMDTLNELRERLERIEDILRRR
ncbi:MAG: hypothetical protein J7J87_03505 [Candidatus Diapherotrites archaeon]|nr:hypothetical protein [Candidatus Diapherotrites archaeon]